MEAQASEQKRPRIRSNAAWALAAQFTKLLVQMGYFVIIARTLKPSEYGAFVAVAALAAAMSAFSGIGSGHLLIRETSRDRSRFASSWGLALLLHLVSGLLLICLLLAVSHWFLPAAVHLPLILAVGFADLVFSRLTDLSFQAFQSVHDAKQMMILTGISSVARLIAACVLAASSLPKSAASWGLLYLAASCLSGLTCVSLVTGKIGRPTLGFGKLKPILIDGFHFATSRSAETIYNDIDKTMLGRMSTLDATAIYSVAYRFVEAACVPINALATATYPMFFEHGLEGVQGTYKFAKTLLPRSIAYGAFASLALFVMAPLLEILMGPLYHESAHALRWLCLLPLLRSVHALLLDVLTGADRQSVRSSVQWGVALVNVIANIWLIPALAWKGASISSVLCDGLLALGLEVAILRMIRTPHKAVASI